MKRLRGAKIFVRRRSDGKYLVLTGSLWPGHPDRSHKPDLPGGIVTAGETYEIGALRELREETGIVAQKDDLTLLLRKMVFIGRFLRLAGLRLYLLETDNPKVTLSWEHEAYDWLSLEELKTLAIRQPYRWLLDKLIKSGLLK